MAMSEELEFNDQLTSGGDVSGDIGGEIFIPMDSGGHDEGTLDEPVSATLVCS